MTTTVDLTYLRGIEEPGTYEIILDEVRYETWRPSRKHPLAERIAWRFRVVGGEHDGECIEHTTELVPDLLPFAVVTPDGRWLDREQAPEGGWAEVFRSTLADHRACLAVAIDCHH